MLGSFIAIEGFGIVFLTTVRSSLIFNFSYLFLDFSYSINIFCKCLSVSYNKMLERLSEAFKIQRQFTENAAHELRTPLSLMQIQLDLYNSSKHPGNDADTIQTIKMVTEQNERLSKMVKTLLDMSELQTVGRDETIIVNALIDEVLADLEPLAQEKNIKLIGKCKDSTICSIRSGSRKDLRECWK